MNNQGTYNALKKMQKGTFRFNRLKLVCKKLEEMGLVSAITEEGITKGYKLTIKGKIFIWDYEHGKLDSPIRPSLMRSVKRKLFSKKSFVQNITGRIPTLVSGSTN